MCYSSPRYNCERIQKVRCYQQNPGCLVLSGSVIKWCHSHVTIVFLSSCPLLRMRVWKVVRYVLYICSSVLVSALVFVVFRYLRLCYKGSFWKRWQLYKMLYKVQVSLQLSSLGYPTLSQLSTGLKDFRGIYFLAFEFWTHLHKPSLHFRIPL